jgi:DNA-binding response OmpR family regulator
MRILVVEDEKKVAKALRDGLEAHHYDVDVAANVQVVVVLFDDLLLMDETAVLGELALVREDTIDFLDVLCGPSGSS